MRTKNGLLLAAAVAAASACAPSAAPPRPVTPPAPAARPVERPRRALVFRAPDFPSVDAPPMSDADLERALDGLPIVRASSVDELNAHLRDEEVSVLVLPYGSAFPVDAWPRLQSFFAHGGGLANLGGAPLHVPVARTAGGWSAGERSPSFAHELLIAPAERLDLGALGVAFPKTTAAWALTPRLTRTKSFPDEHGSAGPREAVFRPLLVLRDAKGLPRACLRAEIDHVAGERAGARWVMATSDTPLAPGDVRAIVTRALEGASELRAIPVRASVVAGGAELRLTRFRAPGRAHATVEDAAGRVVVELDVVGDRVAIPQARAPGLYRVRVRTDGAVAETGFWVKDDRLLASGPRLDVSRDWILRDGKPMPIVGTTYMASDVQRDFLFEPNPAVWDGDFAQMERLGINFVRTGLWSAWSRASNGVDVDEGVLSALEAYVATAARHGIVVCFDFFAFLPPSFGGSNPYLDERSLVGQERFLRAFAVRMKDVSWVHWDLINEPSYAPLAKLWKTRPIGDATEQAAFRDFVTKTLHPGATDGQLRALWRTGEPWATLRDEDLTIGPVQIDRAPRKARDFRAFVEHAVAGWTARMTRVVHEAAGKTLVTLGQDEGGIWERPLQQSFGPSLDYTAVHTWWKNDDLLWDGVTTKLAAKPNLHQETGLMRLENLDGEAWRTPDDAARLLSRKIAYAFAAGGAGVVEWAWNENPYMPIDEESTIGLFRPDQTAKPELDALTAAARFFAKAKDHLGDVAPSPVVVVLPHARVFLGYPNELAATRPVVHALAERFGIVPRAVSDQSLTATDLSGASLVLVPAPDVLDEPAAAALLEASKRGTKVLITGPIAGDSYGRTTPSLLALGVLGPSRPVAMHEPTPWSPGGWVAFENLAQETVRRATGPGARIDPKAAVWHEPLPLELAREREPLVALLGAALEAARVPAPARAKTDGVAVSVLPSAGAALVVVVNETAAATTRSVTVGTHILSVTAPALGAAMLVVDRSSGAVVARLPD